MSSIARFLVAVCTFLMLAATASIEAGTQGFMEGHLRIVTMSAVDSGELPTVAPESYAQYPLIVLSREEKKEVARVTADASGNYRVGLTPGAYILDVQDRAAKRVYANPQPFTVVSNQTVRVDLSIFIGFAKGQASASSG
jgi:DNA-binding transcriptional LysR family regulator